MGNYQRVEADQVMPGDCVRFSDGSGYIVDEVTTDRLGNVRHRNHEGTETRGYKPREILWVRAAREGW